MSSPLSGIQGLVELARRDRVELRPVLLRVLTDLYVQEPGHGPAERARFAELACRLLDSVDSATRAAIAERLASYADTPPALAQKLARDDISVANPILRRSPVLSEAELHAILNCCGIAHAIAIARREFLPASVAKRLRDAGTGRIRPDQKDLNPGLTKALARRFLAAGANERRLILTAMPACPPVEQEERLRRIDRKFSGQLEQAALRHRTQEFTALVHERTGMPSDICTYIVADASGEPLAALCRAFDMPFDMASRILLFLNPGMDASVRLLSGLVHGFEATSLASAQRLAAAWCGLGGEMRKPRPVWTRPGRERNDPRPAARRSIRCVTPARSAAANET